ncbi:unnamed protein product [Darwinula stevensoni]|uniref:DUF4806 domain-containing protein n=1 Tax=Darwinula stevensoni TaxID=69355 RepID=A0A7R9FPK7_9CRUS|nr:unnamed protein product [Darwinula stevensoni]CAG0898074.1 unnamed protein product [Darwinula stevensoni]
MYMDPPTIEEALARWASSEKNVPKDAIFRLLCALRPFAPSLPKTADTLLHNQMVNTIPMGSPLIQVKSIAMKKFVAVEFKDKTNAVIPQKWMLKGGKKCAWPNAGDVDVLVRNEVPPGEDWNIYNVKVLCSSGAYKKCVQRAYFATTDVSSTEVEGVEGDMPMFPSTSESSKQLTCHGRDSGKQRTPRIVPRYEPYGNEISTQRESLENLMVLQKLEKVLFQLKENTRYLEALRADIHDMKNLMTNESNPSLMTSLPGPASTFEELHQLLDSPGIIDVLSQCETPILRETIRSMLKRIMGKNLASQFSLTGLGKGRSRTKASFKAHKAFHTIMVALKRCPNFMKVKELEISKEVQIILRGVCDWYGGRKERSGAKQQFPKKETGEVMMREALQGCGEETDTSVSSIVP